DYQCPFCGAYVRDTFPQLEREYIQTGKVRYIVRDLPLEGLHPLAFKAAEATHCAADQGKFWEMHDRIFANQGGLSRIDLTYHARAIGLDTSSFDYCVDTGKHAARIRTDLADSQRAGITGTPTFFLGLTNFPGAEVKPAQTIIGALEYAAFKDIIENL